MILISKLDIKLLSCRLFSVAQEFFFSRECSAVILKLLHTDFKLEERQFGCLFADLFYVYEILTKNILNTAKQFIKHSSIYSYTAYTTKNPVVFAAQSFPQYICHWVSSLLGGCWLYTIRDWRFCCWYMFNSISAATQSSEHFRRKVRSSPTSDSKHICMLLGQFGERAPFIAVCCTHLILFHSIPRHCSAFQSSCSLTAASLWSGSSVVISMLQQKGVQSFPCNISFHNVVMLHFRVD